MFNKYSILLLLSILPMAIKTKAQSLTLEECYTLAKQNYPSIKKLDLIARTADFDLENTDKRFLPQVNLTAQASYQSDVVGFGSVMGSLLPAGVAIPTLSKDQYKIQADISQLIYDGNNTKNQKELIKANAALQNQNLESSLYTIKQRINSLYFSILLMDAQKKQNETKRESIATQIEKTDAALKNGAAFRSSLDELKAEMVNVEMATTEYESGRVSYLKMLALFIGKELAENTELVIPEVTVLNSEINRPELKAFDLQKSIFDIQTQQLKSDYRPTFSAFGQAGYGRPTLNIIENSFGTWYMAGLKLNWSLSNLYTHKNRKENLVINQKMVDADKDAFLLNIKIDLSQQDEQVLKFTKLIQQDNQAIALRSSVTKSADAQLTNGVITTHEYIQKLNAENLARQTKILHETQLLQARYNQKYITNN